MTDDNAFVYTERDMRAIIQAERERIAAAIREEGAVRADRFRGTYEIAARIARNGGRDE